ncbi:Envoplakin [Talaromyces islandicus]|uniref:Envoplakin n=1 Tax=Talaromyces islandicus TaxID=28573 RepID=A0A0U1LNM4_TALIS|nr:Envoplakin [Talaromyces islandicus]
MSLLDSRQSVSPGPSSSPLQSPFLQRTRGVSPTRRTSSRRLSSRTSDRVHTLPQSSSRKISRNNPPHVNNNIAKSQISNMSSRPQTPTRRDSASTDTTTTLVNPTSTILQGLIKEQRASRGSRKATSDMTDSITAHTTSPSQSHEDSLSEKQRRIGNALSAGIRQPLDMGIREMDQYVSRINKLNFDLKLDIFHRTQQMALLEKKLERMASLEQELERMHDIQDELDELREVEQTNDRLREANEQLQSELDKRDQAISEAVDMICQLESKVDELQAARSLSPSSTTTPQSNNGLGLSTPELAEVSTPKAELLVDIPDRTSSRRGTRRRARKMPSFLHDANKSTAALRSLYLTDENKSIRSVSASTMTTTADSTAEPPSPRLSILSECSYFNPQDLQPSNSQRMASEQLSPLGLAAGEHSNDQRTNDVADWVQPQGGSTGSLRRTRTRAFSDASRSTQVPPATLGDPFQPVHLSKGFHADSPIQLFGGKLPPTPDTMSTFRFGGGSGSNASFSMDKPVTNHAMPGTPSSIHLRLGRPRSAGEMATRPSTAVSGTSDGIDTTMSVDMQEELAGSHHNASGLFHSFNHYNRGSSKATQLLGPGSPSNPRLSCYGGDLLFNGEGVEDIVSGGHEDPGPSTPDLSGHFPTELAASPPLSPQEWLEAAKAEDPLEKAIPEKESNTTEHMAESHQLGQSDLADVNDANNEEPPLPRNSPLRLRTWADDSQTIAEAQPRRRLSLRPKFLSRHRQPELRSDPVAPNPESSPVPAKTTLLTVPKHRRTGSGPVSVPENLSVHGNPETSRTNTRPLPKPLAELRPSTASRPATSDSSEHRRKGSSFLGWMKGSSSKDSELPVGNTLLPRSAIERPKSTVSMDTRAPDISMAYGDASNNLDDEPGWRARRRSRRLA